MWELDCEESWVPENWSFWAVVLEKTLESPLDCKEIQPVHSEGDQSWVFIGRTDAKAETPILWPPHAKSWLIGKDSDAGRDWRQKKKATTEDEIAGWHHWLDGHEFENTRNWWWAGRPGVLPFMGSQRVGHDWATELKEHSMSIGVHLWGLWPGAPVPGGRVCSLILLSSTLSSLLTSVLVQVQLGKWHDIIHFNRIKKYQELVLENWRVIWDIVVVVFQLLSCIWLFATPWAAAC